MTSTTASTTTSIVAPPVAKRVPHVVKFGKNDDVDEFGHNPTNPEKVRAIGDPKSNTLINPPVEIVDDLFWVRDDERKDPDVLDLLRAENAYFEHKTQEQKELAEAIYKEHVSHMKETDDSCPVKYGKYQYWEKTFEGKSYKVHVRAPVGSTSAADEEVLLDINALAEGRSQCDVHQLKPDPKNHAVFAYSLDLIGDELYTIYLRKCKNFASLCASEAGCYGEGDVDKKTIHNTTGDILWMPNSDAIIYITRDDAKRADKVWLHRLSSPDEPKSGEAQQPTTQPADVLLYHEPDQLFSVGANITRDGQYLLIDSGSYESTETLFCPLYKLGNDPSKLTGPECFTPIKKRKFGHRYEVTSWNAGHFLVVTDADGCKTNKLVYVNEATLDDWSRVLIPCIPQRTIESVLALKNGLAIDGRAEGLTQVWTVSLVESEMNYPASSSSSSSSCSVEFFDRCFGTSSAFTSESLRMMQHPEPLYEVSLLFSAAKSFEADTFRINYSSMVTPDQWIDIDLLQTTNRTVVKQKEVPGGYNPENYVCERRWATAADGTKIPLSLLRKKTTVIPTQEELRQHKDGNTTNSESSSDHEWEPPQRHPLLLYGYGSYGISIDPSFRITPLPLLDRGFVYCVAHVRGGGELGKAWYEEGGKLLTKRNTFTDFVACLESVVHEHKLTSPQLIAIEGRSAGGLLVGCMMNMRPDLFKCAVSGVGFVDVMVTMSDASIPLTTSEWGCVGNPNIYQHHACIKSYCPMSNVARLPYPNMLATAGLHDPRVGYWEVEKFVQRLRENTTATQNEIIAKFELSAGHFSANDRYKYLREMSVDQAWVIKQLTGKLQ